ncbi:hypothetical protein [Pseudomonas sp. PDM25]|uniref:hypothetical protein n=1 Tax=Pseudomonas sp. PDM25 TaxID=2854772 RepID=UPI0021109D64|nr:hypothetical protein [Pseudomonas sp. PDM25]
MAFVSTYVSKLRKWPILLALLFSPLIFWYAATPRVAVYYAKDGKGELRYIWNTQHRIDKGGMLPGEATADLGHIFPNEHFFMEFNWRSREGRDHCISIAPKWPKTKIYLDSNGDIDSGSGSGTDVDRLKRCTIDDAKP